MKNDCSFKAAFLNLFRYIAVVATIAVSMSTEAQTPLAQESFEGTFPPTGWTRTTTNSTYPVSKYTTNNWSCGYPGGNSAVFDSYWISSGGNSTLSTPAFSLVGYTSATLTFSLINRATSGFYVDISTNGGSSYVNGSTNYTTTSTTAFEVKTIDLSSYIGNASVMVRFRCISNYGSDRCTNMAYLDLVGVTGLTCTSSTTPTGLTTTTPVICNGSTVTLTVAGGSLGTAASWKVYDGGCGSGSAVATSSTSSITFTPTAGAHTYYVRAEGTCNTTACQTIPCYVFANAPSASITMQNPSSCTSNGTIQFAQVGGGASLWTRSDFSSNPGYVSCNASVSGGECILTPNAGSQSGAFVIDNTSNFNATAFRVQYDQRIWDGSAADGMSFTYGGDFANTGTTCGSERGYGSGLMIGFDTYNNGSDPNGIYVAYAGSQVTYVSFAPRSSAYYTVVINVTSAGQLTVYINNTLYVNVALPAGYVSANKTGWKMLWGARTGGATDKHSIDNLSIIAFDQYEYTINNGGAFTSGTAANQTFTGLAVGNTYAAGTVYLRSKAGAGSVCNGSSNGSAMTVAVPYSPIPAPTASVSPSTICSGGAVTLTASGLAPGRGGSNGSGAYQFTATSSQYLYTNTLTGFPTGSVASAEAWIKPNATQYDGTYNGIISFGPNPAACLQRFLLSMGSDGRITFANWCNDYYSVGSVPFGVWSHVAAVLNGTSLTIYINGKVAGTTTLGATPALAASGQFTVGCTDPGGGRFFNGEIDAVRVWNTARTAAQIQADMYLEAPTNATGLVARYNLNGTFNAQVGPNLTASASAPTATTPAFHTYTWTGASPSGSNPSPSTLEVQTSGALTGNSSFTVTPSANTCSGTASSAQAVTVNAIPAVVSVSGGGTACGSTTLTASGGAGGTIYWQGTTSGGTSTATASTSQTVSASGTYYFRSYNGSCWGAEGSAVVTITTIPAAVTVSGAGTFCGSTTITASGGSPGTIYWQGTTSGGTSTATASSSQTITSNGTYYFRANNAGCWGPEGSAAVVINPVPAAVTVATPGTYCGSTTLTATGGSGGTIYWQGTTSLGTSTATPTTSQSVSATGTYYFRSRSAAGCWGTQGSAAVTIQNNTYGDFSCNPIVVGGLCVGGSYSDTRNNGSYANDYVGQGSGDIYYQFTLPFAATVNVSHCGSGFDTYLYLLNSSGGVVASNDDDGALCSGTAASVSVALSAGTYYVVSEGYSTNTGNITTTISLATTPVNPGTTDNQNQQGIGSWLGQVYDGTAFNTFLGTTTESAIFDETFGGDYSCFPIGYNNNAGTYSVYTETMSIRYRMVKDFPCGAYTFTAGSDDGIRLWVNGVLVIDQWVDRGYTQNSTSPIYLYGPTSLQLEYYEGGGGNRCSFTYSSTPVNILGSVNVSAQPSTCGGNGTINVTPSTGSATLWYNNDMNYSIPRGSQTLTSASLYSFNYNTPASKDSWLGLTTNGGSQNGSLVINNQYSLNATSFRTEFDLYIGGGTGADGLSLSYGPDVAAGGGCNGTGSGIRLVFDTYNNAGSPCQGVQGGNVGIGMFYGGFSLGQQYACNTSNNIRNAWKHCVFTVNSSGVGTLTIDGIGTIFSAALPAAYLAVTDKTAWKWAATASTGGAYDYHAIDNLVISAYDQYEYSADGSTWQSSASFTKPAGSYTLYARNKSGECVSTLGTATIYDPTPPSPPSSPDVTVQICSNGSTGTISVNTPPTNVVTDWYSTPSGGSPIAGGTAVNSVTVTAGTYYAEARNTVTLCKSTTRTAISLTINPIPAAPTSGGNVSACNGTSGTLSATPPASPAGTIIDWYTTGGTLLSASSNTYTTSTAGTYVAVSQSPAGCSSNPGTNITLTVLGALNYGTVSNTGETICNNGDPASFGFSTAPSGGTGSFSYQWYYKDGVNTAPTGTTFPNGWNIIGGATSNSYNPPAGLTTTRTYACGVDATGSPDCAPMTWAAGQWVVTVRPDAVATISGTTTVCLNSTAPTVTFSNSTALPITVTYNVNSGSNQTINIAASGTATVTQATSTAGTFAYNLVSAVFQSAPTCVNTLSGSATVTVRPAAVATVSGTTSVCLNDAAPSVTFNNSTALPITVTYNVNGGSNQTINVAASGTATVSQATGTAGAFAYNLVSAVFQTAPTCVNTLSGSATVTVRPAAVATISGTTTVCQNDAAPSVTFNNSTALPITVTYNVNGGSNQTVNVAASSTATASQATTSAGSFAYNLVSAVFQTAPTCVNTLSGSATVTVRATPTATISGTTTVCQYDAPQTITFTNPMSLPVTVTYNVNGGSAQTINVAANGTATVSQVTTADGAFAYNLVSVVYQNAPTCSNSLSGSATVTVRPKLDATISGNATVCQGSAAPNVTFNNPQALPITITYTVNGGSNQTINVPASSSATVAVSTATPGSFVYSIVSGSYQTAPNCPNSVGGVVTVVVQAPIVLTATATPNPVCYDGSLVLTSTVAQGTGITSWSWTGPGGFTASTQNTSRSNMHTGSSYEGIYYVSATNVCGASTPQPTASVVVHPEITANVVIDECASVGPDNYYMLVTAAGGVPDYTFNSATMVVSSDTAVYEVAAGNTDYFTITDASSCSIVVSGTAPTGHPTDIALSSTTGIKSVNCYEMGLNKWLSFRDDATNEVIMSINDNGQNLGQVNVTVYKEVTEPATYTTGPNCQDFTDFKAMQRHFMVTTSNAPTGPVGVRLYFTAAEANALHAASIGNNIPGNSCTENDDFNDPTGLTDLYITKYTGADEDGDYTNNHAAGLYRVFGTANGMNTPDGPLTKGAGQFGNLFTGAQSHHYVELNVTEFSEFWASGSFHASALPVEMIYLEANAIDNSYIQLKWATAIEINNKGFQVERSLDGQTWNTIGWVDGHDNSTVQQNYTYNDMDVTGGVRYYYRLKQVDFDGAFEYTDLVSAIITQQSTFNVKDFVPNPTLNNTNLVVTSSVDQDIDVAFYNLLGEVVSSSKHSLHKGGNQINFSLSTLAAGTYTAVVTSNNEVYSKKIVVVK